MITKALLLFFTAFIVTSITMPSIIKIAVKRLLFDEHTEARKIHTKDISNLGGIGIFTGFFFCILLFQIVCDNRELGSLAAAAVLLFFVALKDDLTPSSPIIRLLLQFVIAGIIVFVGEVHLTRVPFIESEASLTQIADIAVSIVFIVGMINAMNFIDGIDGLAGSIGLLISLAFGMIFFLHGEMSYCYTAWALAGAILGFLLFNFSPAKIFMGDMGSMLIGVFVAIFAIKTANMEVDVNAAHLIQYPGNVVLALLIVPIMDMVTVILVRLSLKQSPFHADKRHLHHKMIELGMGHPAICLTLVAFNLLTVGVCLALQKVGTPLWANISIVMLAVAFEFSIRYLCHQKTIKNPTTL